MQVGCLVLVVSIGTFGSSDATLKTTVPDFRENTVPVECAAPHIVAAWCFNHAMFKSSVGAVQLMLVEGGIRFLGITSMDVKESSFSNKSHVLGEPSSGELGFK